MSRNSIVTGQLCLFYKFQTEDLYQDMARNKELFDTSNYPKNHFIYSETNRYEVEKMKDKTGGVY